jgi:prepilin-type processing-associated H-X9-DG protein
MVRWFTWAAMTGAIAWLAAAPADAQTCAAPGTVSTACTGAECAAVTAAMVSGAKGSPVDIGLSFKQGADDSQAGQGFDEVAALAFTLGVPGTGDAAPLTFACTDGNLADGAVTVAPAIADDFTVVVENAQCTNRNRCLCPDTGAGQTRDNFVNIVVYGPRNLPEQGPVQIPVLPDDGPIATLRMVIDAGAPAEIPLHFFSALDGAPAKPAFAANLSIGDQAACDVSANPANRSNVAFVDGKVTTSGGVRCVGDCDAGGSVSINELVVGVNIALGLRPVADCSPFACTDGGSVPINCLVQGVNNALGSCPVE